MEATWREGGLWRAETAEWPPPCRLERQMTWLEGGWSTSQLAPRHSQCFDSADWRTCTKMKRRNYLNTVNYAVRVYHLLSAFCWPRAIEEVIINKLLYMISPLLPPIWLETAKIRSPAKKGEKVKSFDYWLFFLILFFTYRSGVDMQRDSREPRDTRTRGETVTQPHRRRS